MVELNRIRIHNAVFYAYHGVLSEEQNLGARFELDVDMFCDMAAAAETDALKHTIDYAKVYSSVQRMVAEKKYRLIETVANTIAQGLLKEFSHLEKVVVRVRKPHPPLKGVVDYVEVEVTHSR
ncbi:MAG: dihydroneopterin aldolase [Bacteroidota bacterium]